MMTLLPLATHAGSASFSRATASVVTRGSRVADLMVTWKETGLPAASTMQYQLDADVSATFICEAGGSVVAGPTTVSGPIASVFPAQVSSQGSTLQSAFLDEIDGPSCNGATRRIVSVEYDSPEICDVENNICQQLGGPFAKTFCTSSKPTACPAT